MKTAERSALLCLLGWLIIQQGCKRGFDGPAFLGSSAIQLKELRDEWVAKGRPEHFEIPPVYMMGGGSEIFAFTNGATVNVNKTAYHCRFGKRKPYWPQGVLAVTDDGVTLWISDKDGEITLSPERQFFDP